MPKRRRTKHGNKPDDGMVGNPEFRREYRYTYPEEYARKRGMRLR